MDSTTAEIISELRRDIRDLQERVARLEPKQAPYVYDGVCMEAPKESYSYEAKWAQFIASGQKVKVG